MDIFEFRRSVIDTRHLTQVSVGLKGAYQWDERGRPGFGINTVEWYQPQPPVLVLQDLLYWKTNF
jgi:hypothetical protein